MPKMDGVEFAKKLKEMNYPAKVYMITGHYKDIDEESCENVGIIKVFYKPVDFDEILDLIAQLTP